MQCQTVDLVTVWKNSFKGLNIDYIQYSNIIRITYYSYSYLCTILNPNIICICVLPNICARILFVFVFAHSEKKRILFVFVFGQKSDSKYYLYSYLVQKQYSLTSDTDPQKARISSTFSCFPLPRRSCWGLELH